MSSRSSSRRIVPDDDRVVVGRVVAAHGIRGEISIEPLTDNPERFRPGSRVWLSRPGGPERELEILNVRPHRGRLLARLSELEDRDAAEELRDAEVFVRESDLPPAPEGSYYHFEIEGCRCRDIRLGSLGTVRRVLEDGGGELLEIVSGERVLLIPFVEPYLRKIDVESKIIELDLPEGLVDACTST